MDAADEILRLAADYKGKPHREMTLDGLVYGYLFAKHGVKRQYKVRNKSKKRPDRIDFRQPAPNPVVIEFAVRTKKHKNEVYGTQNSDELRKLAKQVKAKARYLLLLDLSEETALTKANLKKTYDKINAGKGKFPRTSVRVLYVHPHRADSFHFLWQPWKK